MEPSPLIAVVRMDNLGDHVLGSGLLPALRAAYPQARIAVATPIGLADLYARCPSINHLIMLPDLGDYLNDPERFARIIGELEAGEKFDLVINPRFAEDYYLAGPICRAMTRDGGKTVGFRQDLTPRPGYDANTFYTALADAADDLHASRYAGVLLQQLGLPHQAEPAIWFLPQDAAYVRERYAPGPEPYVVIGCGASYPNKLPTQSLFRHVVDRLTNTWGKRVILVGGPADEAMARSLSDAGPAGRITSTVGELKLYQLGALLSGAELYVGPDSGPMHLAAAAGVAIIELGWVPADHPRKSRGVGTAGWCWSPWSQPTITLHPDPAGFAQRRRSPDFASLPVDDIPPTSIDDALGRFLAGRRPPPEVQSGRTLDLEQDGRKASLMAPVDHQLDHHRARHPLYDRQLPQVAREVERLAPGELFVDIGANIGDTTALLRLAGCHNPILAFEPSARFAAFARSNLADLPDVELREMFVGPANCALGLDEHSGTASPVQDIGPEGVSAPTVPLGSLAGRRTALVKTDTDGFDTQVLGSGLEFLRSEKPLIWAEAEVRTPRSVNDWVALLGAISGSHPRVIAFDNFGFPVVYGELVASLATLRDLLEYCRRHRIVPATHGGEPRIYYLDIALFPDRLNAAYQATVHRFETQWAHCG